MTKKRHRKRGSGSVVKATKDNRTWGCKWTENGVRHYRGGYPDRDAAEQALATFVANVRAGLPGAKPRVKVSETFAEVVPLWLEARRSALRSWNDDRNRYSKHLKSTLGSKTLGEVDTGSVERLVSGLRDELDPASVERVVYTLSSIYRWAIRVGKVDRNPVKEYLASLGRVERASMRSQHDPSSTPYLHSISDVVRVYRALPEPVATAYALSALAGLRPGEAVAVEWGDIDLVRGLLTVRRSSRNGKVTAPKSGKPRVVPIGDGLVTMLLARKTEAKGEQVVPAKRGHVCRETIQDALDTALSSLDLPRLTFYEAGRHTFASLWVLAGKDIYRLATVMGHASVETTMRYAHLQPKASDALDVRLTA